MRKALVVGIDFYSSISSLYGCVNDAHSVKSVLDRHADGSVNFGVKLKVASDTKSAISKRQLKQLVEELFADDSDVALLYFAGHGYVEAWGGYLCTSECESGDDGMSLSEVLTIANASGAKNKVIVLDSCHSGVMGKLQGEDCARSSFKCCH